MVVRLAITSIVFCCSLLPAGVSQAATKELTRAVTSAIPWDQQQPDSSQRKKFAEAIQEYWENFDSRVPRLSPAEREWIETELGAQGERLERAFRSKEYSIWSLNQHVDSCLDTIRNVLASFESEQSQDTEMFFWLKMINCYDGTDDIVIFLQNAGIRYNDDTDRHIQTPLSNIIQTIIVNRVAPMAMIETMNWTVSSD